MKSLVKGLLIVTMLGSVNLHATVDKQEITSIETEGAALITPVVVTVYDDVASLAFPVGEKKSHGAPLRGGGTYALGANQVLPLKTPINIGGATDKYKPLVSVIVERDKVYTYDLSDILAFDKKNESGKWLLKITKDAVSFEKPKDA